MAVEELDYVETAAIHEEAVIPRLEKGRDELPGFHIGIGLLDFTPRGVADALAMGVGW